MGPRNDPAQKKRKESGRQPLKIDGGRSQVGLDLHVGEAAPHRAREPMPRLGLAVEALGTPAMTLIEWSSSDQCNRRRRARSKAGYPSPTTTALKTRPLDRQSPLSGHRAQSLAFE
jgi:hypothetical protein